MAELEIICEVPMIVNSRRENIMITHLKVDQINVFGAMLYPLDQVGHKHYGTGASIEFAVANLIEKQRMIEVYDAEGNYSLSYPNAGGERE